MKVFLVAYAMFSLGTLILQLFASDFFLLCEYNGGACTYMVLEYTWNALTWPHYLLFA